MAQSRCIQAGDRSWKPCGSNPRRRAPRSRCRTDRPAARPARSRSRIRKSGGYAAAFTLNGFLPDTEQIQLQSMGDNTSQLRPNPVVVQLTPAPPPPKPKKKVRHRRVARRQAGGEEARGETGREAEAGRRQARASPDADATAAGTLALAAGTAAATLICRPPAFARRRRRPQGTRPCVCGRAGPTRVYRPHCLYRTIAKRTDAESAAQGWMMASSSETSALELAPARRRARWSIRSPAPSPICASR